MTRIISGVARGRRLVVPSTGTRPTSDRVREALFSSWESSCGGLVGLRIADLYAGSGAIGLEALSRGAAHALMVERDRKTARLIEANMQVVGCPGARVVADDVTRVVTSPPVEPYDLIFLDPPYEVGQTVVDEILADLVGNAWLAPDAIVVIERGVRDSAVAWPVGFADPEVRKYGDTVLVSSIWYGHDT